MRQGRRPVSAPGPTSGGRAPSPPARAGDPLGNAGRAERLFGAGQGTSQAAPGAEQAPGGSEADTPDTSMGTAELAIYLLEELEAGNADALQGVGAANQGAAATVIATLQKNRAFVDRCITEGVERTAAGGVERVRPAPAHAIAGFLGLSPRDPAYRAPE